MTRPRVRLPGEAKVGDLIEIRALISHVMETGQRKQADGSPVPRFIINAFSAKYAGIEVFSAELYPAISANPFLAFYMRVPGPGEFEFTWTDDKGGKVAEKQKLNVV